jgi:hypothetical protein
MKKKAGAIGLPTSKVAFAMIILHRDTPTFY